MGNGISWLHLSDLHYGSSGFLSGWGSVRSLMWMDLRGLINKLDGELDLVLFTGDLTQSATPEQFDGLRKFLEELWHFFETEKCRPKLFAVPGNHDLVRPTGAALKGVPYNLLRDSWQKDYVQKDFWDRGAASDARELVRKAFANYATWWAKPGFPKVETDVRDGILPGDLTATFEKDGIRLGLAGMNSAFLQMRDGIREDDGVLDMRPEQLHAACNADGAARWVDSHDVCFLLTHHPVTWLVDGGDPFVKEVCDGPGRFALHLFGHMHEQRVAELSVQGGQPRRTLQGASLFSLEPWGDEPNQRKRLVSGYSVGRLVRRGAGYAYSMFPRIQIEAGGQSRIEKDPSFEYDSPAHESTRWKQMKARRIDPSGGEVLATTIAQEFRLVAALAGPPRYTDVHEFLKGLLKRHGAALGPVQVKNIAFDMQHTYPCLQAICERSWPQGIHWRTVFIDHEQDHLSKALRNDVEIKLDTARDNEQRLSKLVRAKAKELAANKIKLDARAYDDLPSMHGFLVNERVLIVGICMLEKLRIRTSPYMVFLLEGEDSNVDPAISKEMIEMFSAWFDSHWSSGRVLSAKTKTKTSRAAR